MTFEDAEQSSTFLPSCLIVLKATKASRETFGDFRKEAQGSSTTWELPAARQAAQLVDAASAANHFCSVLVTEPNGANLVESTSGFCFLCAWTTNRIGAAPIKWNG
jgi:hypothetical protein